ncbi:TIGR03032 family protein [Paraburkholderia bryophila]|uniref:TIGR03032 family protein n=1 Tax=Paraburkholderia bryophila TaxID=420952 RepID=UPI00234BD203|nr:TIGR03032 family protein [Paraburkholderia bryophila]WCM21720.1 TIGR03032 family protein [Paraburkholderia bryophila]
MIEKNAGMEYSTSPGLIERLTRLGGSIAFTSYQSGQLYLLGRDPRGGAHLHTSAIAQPMGLAFDATYGLTLCAGASIMQFQNGLRADEQVNHTFDACYVPRTIHVTGELDAHDVGVERDGRVIFVNTRFNCLATVSARHSFDMVWKPHFISALVDEDRCHLNGLAMNDGRAAYVTAVSRSNTVDGWRDRRGDGGVVIDVATGDVICEGLSMPHSPRMYNGELWLLNAGTGELGVVRRPVGGNGMGTFEPRAFCPGFLRGLAFHEGYAFVGLSKPRYKRFEGLALDQRLKDADSEAWCGIQIIDLRQGSCVDWLRIDGQVAELYDVAFLPGAKCPMAISPASDDLAGFVTFDSMPHPD